MPYTVYVIELDPEVLKEARFVAANPGRDDEKPCVYVGSTVHTPEERLQQHLTGYKSNRYAYRYGVRLLPKLYRNLQDYETRKEAEAAEVRCANRLRRRGYGVWQG